MTELPLRAMIAGAAPGNEMTAGVGSLEPTLCGAPGLLLAEALKDSPSDFGSSRDPVLDGLAFAELRSLVFPSEGLVGGASDPGEP